MRLTVIPGAVVLLFAATADVQVAERSPFRALDPSMHQITGRETTHYLNRSPAAPPYLDRANNT